MFFGEIESNIKSIIQESIGKRIHEEDVANLPVTKQNLLDTFYTNVMALGLNENIDAAVDDLYETKSPIEEAMYGQVMSTKEFLRNTLQVTQEECKNELNAYKIAVSLKRQAAPDGVVLATLKQLIG